mmetsp:Transcript_67498/g.146949  ORF Transcript_67498/g.146949 Transcript_67498/m.146949 type:complete len:311 (-) Transcript_67498:8-940(-)
MSLKSSQSSLARSFLGRHLGIDGVDGGLRCGLRLGDLGRGLHQELLDLRLLAPGLHETLNSRELGLRSTQRSRMLLNILLRRWVLTDQVFDALLHLLGLLHALLHGRLNSLEGDLFLGGLGSSFLNLRLLLDVVLLAFHFFIFLLFLLLFLLDLGGGCRGGAGGLQSLVLLHQGDSCIDLRIHCESLGTDFLNSFDGLEPISEARDQALQPGHLSHRAVDLGVVLHELGRDLLRDIFPLGLNLPRRDVASSLDALTGGCFLGCNRFCVGLFDLLWRHLRQLLRVFEAGSRLFVLCQGSLGLCDQLIGFLQ